MDAICICKDRNIRTEYLGGKGKGAVDIMMVLYDEREIMRSYAGSEAHEARYDEKVETAKEMLQNHELIEKYIVVGRDNYSFEHAK